MRILVTGSHGLVGSKLVTALEAEGHQVIRLTRAPSASAATIILWDPHASEIIERNRLEALDAIVHLAGENIGAGRWTPDKKASIRNSRVQGTGLLSRTLADLKQPPKLFISASAIGYYGNRGEEELRETSSLGTGFLAGVCRDWEEATAAAAEAGIRTVCLRMGFILSADRGGLTKMLLPFRLGLGGPMGSGKQWMSWISVEDVVAIIQFILANEHIAGPVNAVTPSPVRNRDFARALGKALSRPAFLPLPAFAVRLLLGEMGETLSLTSAKVLPEVLLREHYAFRYPDLEQALDHELGNAG